MTVDHDQHLAAIVAGDADAFGRWVAGVELGLRGVLRPFAAVVDTEAVLQETLLRVWQAAPRHTPDGRPHGLFRLAARIARNLAIDEARRARGVSLDDEVLALQRDLPDAPERGAPDPHLRRALAECHAQLTGRPAEAFTMRFESAGAEPDATLAERLGMRLNTFLQNVTRARKLLTECLERRHVDLTLELR